MNGSIANISQRVGNQHDAFTFESSARSYCRRFPVTFEHAEGSIMTNTEGRDYIDFLAGCSALNYGHNDPDMTTALLNYVSDNGVVHGLDMQTRAKESFIDSFVTHILAPRKLRYNLQFTGPTGTNAVEAALKLARKVTGRMNVIAFTNGFHGVSLGALATTGNRYNRMCGSSSLPDVTRAYYDGYFGHDVNTAQMLDKALSDPSSGFDAPAAILLETVQGEGGLNVATDRWLQEIAAVAKRHGALLIIDDIQAGCGRTGSFFSFDSSAVQPDIVTLSKSLSGYGLPMALVLIRPDLDQWQPAEHNGTFRGNNLAFLTATVALDKFWANDALRDDIKRRGKIVECAMKQMCELLPAARLKGRGMMLGIDVRDGSLADRITADCFDNGLIIETSGPQDEVIKFLGPLTTPDDLLVEGLGILRASLARFV